MGLNLAQGLLMLPCRNWGDKPMGLTPPSQAALFLAVLLAVLALLVRYAHMAIPLVSGYSFETLLVAFLLLLAGNIFRGF
jgi:hypothetical protein